ncbi:hypothetical protein PVAND_014081 [Polypedilum vanderplanki]|uniref:Uncharacterized protein n=1 Tax=Polypedilum vanderplanki TaxID=319348 RepID=A0A9J6CSM7_POLVA|nr:hypothetical protein PVAND_014081 [Polypedilum vanderplanki]
MTLAAQKKLILASTSSPTPRMVFKLSSLALLLLFCYTSVSTYFYVGKVVLPEGCANACPPQRDPQRFICARNVVTGQLGMFDGECQFGRYNHCIHTRQRYAFVRYGSCRSTDYQF